MKNCRGCNRRYKSTCPISGYIRECPCKECLVKLMCIIDCERFKLLKAQTFKDFLRTIVKYEKDIKKNKEVKGLTPSWVTYEEAVWEENNG